MREIISAIRNLPKHLSTALQNLVRNGSMSLYSIIAVTVTLGLMGIIGVIALNVNSMTNSIEDSLSIYVKLERNITDEQAAEVGNQIAEIDGVNTYTYASKDEELQKMTEYYGDEASSIFADYTGDNNPLAGSYDVEVEDASKLEKVTKQIREIENVNKASYGGSSTATLVSILETVRDYGMILVAGLGIVVILLISSTIHMAIENRNSEVEIMRMVGASNWYIRIPFAMEGALIGLIGAIIPILLIFIGYEQIFNNLKGEFMASMLMLVSPSMIMRYSWVLIAIGMLVGLFGSLIALSKHLRN